MAKQDEFQFLGVTFLAGAFAVSFRECNGEVTPVNEGFSDGLLAVRVPFSTCQDLVGCLWVFGFCWFRLRLRLVMFLLKRQWCCCPITQPGMTRSICGFIVPSADARFVCFKHYQFAPYLEWNPKLTHITSMVVWNDHLIWPWGNVVKSRCKCTHTKNSSGDGNFQVIHWKTYGFYTDWHFGTRVRVTHSMATQSQDLCSTEDGH